MKQGHWLKVYHNSGDKNSHVSIGRGCALGRDYKMNPRRVYRISQIVCNSMKVLNTSYSDIGLCVVYQSA